MKTDSSHRSKRPYDLEERTYEFALQCRLFLKSQKMDPVSWPDIRQVIRSTGSVAANYVESLEGVSPDDTLYRLRLCRKEAQESGLWLRLLADCNELPVTAKEDLLELTAETRELVRIFSSIIHKKNTPSNPS